MSAVLLAGIVGRDITPAGVAEALAEPGPVRLVLDSPGGCHAAATAIYHQFRARPGVSVHIVKAASAAVFVALAADWRTIAPDGRMLVHRGATATAGTAADLRRQADALAELDAYLAFYGAAGQHELAAEIRRDWLRAAKC